MVSLPQLRGHAGRGDLAAAESSLAVCITSQRPILPVYSDQHRITDAFSEESIRSHRDNPALTFPEVTGFPVTCSRHNRAPPSHQNENGPNELNHSGR
jgi:hypothetical protein